MSRNVVFACLALIAATPCMQIASAKTSTSSDWVVKAQILAKQNLAKKLKDPSSARYRNVHAYKDVIRGNTVIVFCGLVNAKNSFGGYHGYERFMAGASIAALASQLQNPDRVWSKVCKNPMI